MPARVRAQPKCRAASPALTGTRQRTAAIPAAIVHGREQPRSASRARGRWQPYLGRAIGTESAAATDGAGGKMAVPKVEGKYNVVITGSTKGVGLALAKKFLECGDSVIVSSRADDRVDAVTSELQQQYGKDRVEGRVCNVAKATEVAELAAFAKSKFGVVDIWINNAGTNAYKYETLVESTEEDLMQIVETNVLGTMLCCREAIKVMKEQEQGGHIFNMDGAGADGQPTPRFAAYGATKRGLLQLSKSLEAELKMRDITNVGVHNLSPGMVTTDLLMSGADTPTAKFFINCLAEEPQDVAEYLVPRIRSVSQVPMWPFSIASGTYIKFLTKAKAYSQIFSRLLSGTRKGRFVEED